MSAVTNAQYLLSGVRTVESNSLPTDLTAVSDVRYLQLSYTLS